MSETLLRRGGTNAAGFPVYRMVRSEAVIEKVGGRWNEWDADLNIQDRGGIASSQDGKPVQTHHRPDRIVVEVRAVPKYSHLDQPGWVLERWYPATFFGSPSQWQEHVVLVEDNSGHFTVPTRTPLLGPYPSQGQYVMIVGPFPQEPALGFVQDYIASWEERRASFPQDVEQHIKDSVERAEKKDEARRNAGMEENAMRIRQVTEPLTSTSLEAGRWRSRMFERAGHTSHIGN